MVKVTFRNSNIVLNWTEIVKILSVAITVIVTVVLFYVKNEMHFSKIDTNVALEMKDHSEMKEQISEIDKKLGIIIVAVAKQDGRNEVINKPVSFKRDTAIPFKQYFITQNRN